MHLDISLYTQLHNTVKKATSYVKIGMELKGG